MSDDSFLKRNSDMLQKFAALGGLFALLIIFSLASSNFGTTNNMITILLQTTSIALMGIGVTYVIITGGIDLSIGSVVAFAGVVAALLVKNADFPVWLAFVAAVIAGIIAGAINGCMVNYLRLPPFIATLGMMMIVRGVALQMTGARSIAGLPKAFGTLGNEALWKITAVNERGITITTFPGIPYPVILLAVLAVIFAYILSSTKLGRYIYAVGSNEEATRLSGINVRRVKLSAYMISGGFAAITGIVLMSRLITAQPNAGVAYEMDAIASAVIGGTSLMGGVGTISGTIIGAFIIGVLRNGLNMLNVQYFIQQVIIGVVIIVAVSVDRLRDNKK